MSRQTIVIITCDRCESTDDVKTVPLPGGREVDLCELDRNTLEDVLAPFVEVSRKAEKPLASVRPITAAKSYGKADKAQHARVVRAWAVSLGVVGIPHVGRVPAEVLAAYAKQDKDAMLAYGRARLWMLAAENRELLAKSKAEAVPAATFQAPESPVEAPAEVAATEAKPDKRRARKGTAADPATVAKANTTRARNKAAKGQALTEKEQEALSKSGMETLTELLTLDNAA